ncbi:50S ribosomal L9 C-terminal domain-containing protein [Ruminococcus sp.]
MLIQYNINIDKRKVVLESDIKEFGSYKADVKLYSGIVANITVKVSEA